MREMCMMKKFLSITLCVLMIFGLVACGSNGDQAEDIQAWVDDLDL